MRKTLWFSFLSMLCVYFCLVSSGESQEVGKAFCMPKGSPLYPPPPIQYRGNRILTVVFKSDPETIKKLVPEPLVPNPFNLMFVYVSQLNIEVSETENYPYLEAGIGVPATFSKKTGNFAVVLYLDEALPIVGGREVWGWPKKEAVITFDETGGEIQANLERLGFPILSVHAKNLKKIEPIPKTPSMPWYNLKIIPSVEKDVLPEVYQLTSTENKNQVIQQYFSCEAELEFKSSPHDLLGEIEVIEVVDVSFQVSDFVMDYGKVVHDYLGENKRAPVRESKNIGGKDACDR